MNMMERFTQHDSYIILLQGGFFGRNRTYVAFQDYEPSLNIKCDPPFNLQSNISASKCQLWWSVPGPLEPILQYELEYKEHNTSWEQAHHKQLFNAVTKVEIEAMEFEAGITYTLRVRCKTSQVEDGYKSQWSEWSQTTEFQRAAPPGAKNVVLSRFVSLYKTERERDMLGNGGAVSSRFMDQEPCLPAFYSQVTFFQGFNSFCLVHLHCSFV
uniref:Fibronectin type-III domain-containing protein n=1 Tax=Chrysemys picta bellii TaxID=8478 RepID=A0A8C3F4L0_CHRPI